MLRRFRHSRRHHRPGYRLREGLLCSLSRLVQPGWRAPPTAGSTLTPCWPWSREEQTEALAPNRGAGRHERPRAGALGPGQPAGEHVLSSSFGIQAALMLHLVSRERLTCPWC